MQVTPAALTISAVKETKIYGDVLTAGPASAKFTSAALQNNETIGSVSISYQASAATTAAAGNYTGAVAILAATGGTFTPANYTITYRPADLEVVPAPLYIAADNVTKPFGDVLTAGTGFTNFTSTGLKNAETVGSVTVNYKAGWPATDAAGLYNGAVEISAATGGTFSPLNYTISYAAGNLTVTPPPAPIINVSAALPGLSTIYGSASAPGAFMVSGNYLTGSIVITPPQGFELSTDNTNYNNTLTIGSAGNLASTTIYIRLSANAAAGNYSGNVTLNSALTAGVSVAIASSVIKPAALTITADDKARVTGLDNPTLTVTYNGFVNNETIASLAVLPTITTPATITSVAGLYPITASGAVAANYSISYVDGTLTITTAPQLLITANTFTPNGDGINDTWELKNVTADTRVQIYNRAGQQVFSSIGYGTPWDGRYKGSTLQPSTYYYMITLKNSKHLSGYVTIIR